MKYLLYGIMRQDDSPGHSPEPGLCRLSAHGLAAVASPREETLRQPSVSALLAYEKVVEAIHARHAVIPLRYGCVMECESAVTRLLDDHHQEYECAFRPALRDDGDGYPRPVARAHRGCPLMLHLPREPLTWPPCETATAPQSPSRRRRPNWQIGS